MNDNNALKVMFGEHAMQAHGQILMQKQEKTKTGYLTTMVVICHTTEDLFSPEANAMGAMHELIIGDFYIRPHGKFASTKFKGRGLAGLMTSEAMFPISHEVVTLDNGYKDSHRPRNQESPQEV
jgi:hypothetical protein